MTTATAPKKEHKKGRKVTQEEPAVSQEQSTTEEIKGEELPKPPPTRSAFMIFMEKVERLEGLLQHVENGIPIDPNALQSMLKDVEAQAHGRCHEDFAPEEKNNLGYTLLECARTIAERDGSEILNGAIAEFVGNTLEHHEILSWLNHGCKEDDLWQIIPCKCGNGYQIARGETARKLQKQYELYDQIVGVKWTDASYSGTEILSQAIQQLDAAVRYNQEFPGDSIGRILEEKAQVGFFAQLAIRIGERIDDPKLPFRVIDTICLKDNFPMDVLEWLNYYVTRKELTAYLEKHHSDFWVRNDHGSPVGFRVINGDDESPFLEHLRSVFESRVGEIEIELPREIIEALGGFILR